MIRSTLSSIILAALTFGTSATTDATLIEININVPVDQIGVVTFDVSGFRFTAEVGRFSMREYGGGGMEDYFFFGSGDPALPPPASPLTRVSIERIGGGTFDFLNLKEIADAAGIFELGKQTLTSDRGGFIDLSFSLPNPNSGVLRGTMDAPVLFTGITRLTFNELERSVAAYDNFRFQVADVPEPATILLFTVGGFALVYRRMRRVRLDC